MEFKVFKASGGYEEKIEINTIEELIELKEKCGYGLIIDKFDNIPELYIMIYDEYIE